MSDLRNREKSMGCSKTYEGDMFFGRYSGNGKLLLPDGSMYEGEFWNGVFHGKGTLYMPEGKLEGTWDKGKTVQVKFIFSDGLVYEPESWTYCDGPDRRFYPEILHGIHALGELEQHNS